MHFRVLVEKKLKTANITRFCFFYFGFSKLACFHQFYRFEANQCKMRNKQNSKSI
ncbi:hypothetical protein E2C01_014752 [Portunus trituberculatus]|uniref:Uncharacterized protein n=1 Tax=Portunus trituberculatus TaxID=210409 RepID=A0A5B7DL20_PORTR|nr:hypothetical protein [Portunus trituberculatus]MPC21759.1 hypothetical protein [Portunus trituberculatus]